MLHHKHNSKMFPLVRRLSPRTPCSILCLCGTLPASVWPPVQQQLTTKTTGQAAVVPAMCTGGMACPLFGRSCTWLLQLLQQAPVATVAFGLVVSEYAGGRRCLCGPPEPGRERGVGRGGGVGGVTFAHPRLPTWRWSWQLQLRGNKLVLLPVCAVARPRAVVPAPSLLPSQHDELGPVQLDLSWSLRIWHENLTLTYVLWSALQWLRGTR